MNLEVKVANKEELKKWDEIVDFSPMATIFHKLDWLKITEEHTKSKFYPLVVYKEQEIIGMFPIFYQKKHFLKTVFSPPSKTGIPNLGPVILIDHDAKQYKKEEILNEFIKKIDQFLKDNLNFDYCLIKCVPELVDCRPFIWLGYDVSPSYTYYLNLLKWKDDIWNNLKKDVRTDVRYAENTGMTASIQNDKSSLEFVYNLSGKRYEEQSRKYPVPKKYLFDLFDKFKNHFNIFISQKANEKVNGLILLQFKDKVSHMMGAVKTDIRGAADLLLWESIKWSIDKNYKFFELVGANTERLCKFKSKYNPNIAVYFNVEKSTSFSKTMKKIYVKFHK